MRQIIPYIISGMALAMLVGGVVLVGTAIKTWMHERKSSGPVPLFPDTEK